MLVLACLAPLCLSSPTAADASAPIHVRFVNPGFASGGFWRSVSETMRAAAEQLGLSLEISYGEREWPRMRANAEAAIASPSPPDYLILVNEHGQAADLVRAADARGVPTLLLLNTLTDRQVARVGRAGQELPCWLGSLTPDNERAGHEMATALFDAARGLSPQPGRIALMTLAGDVATPASQARLAGLDRALAAAPDVDERRRLVVDWSYDEAYRRIDTWLSTQRRFDAIWAANDPIALGAMAAAERHGLMAGRDYAVVGMNWSTAALARVNDGEMTLTHGGHFLAGAWAMVLLHDLHHGIPITAETTQLHFPMAALRAPIPGALQEILTQRQWSRIDFRRFSRYHHPERTGYDFSLAALQAAIRPLEAADD
ncbi:ABC transporter substrate-binding protein [Halomonas organivorans]|uniref:ABC-type sugar transport system substrate-binding protein n=1 Tax=Halomonas organivorans TaxID=257772 RepID=A0A7W5BUS2_9GAMM|nr:ABC transporter substrate-binding protein [Halomonas organivorans]MBB3139410.1 ABC-type sugar transport system substrate-binding protein [Halomonas organivorans]